MHRCLLALATAAAFSAVLVLMPVGRAMACSCVLLNEAAAFDSSDVVFEGVAAASRPLVQGDGFIDVAVTFAVEKELSGGPLPERLTIATMGPGTSCGSGFQVGQRWRVLASNTDGMLYSGPCSQNRLIDQRAPIPPLGSGTEADGPGASLTIPVLISLGVVALLTVISLLAFRKQARPTRD
jgi:hypothetical protein